MNPVCEIIHNKGEYKGVIPNGAPWDFRWGFQGVRTALRYLRVYRVLDKHPTVDDPPEAKNPREEYRKAKFSCLYGRLGKQYLRRFVQVAENREIAHRKELRSLIQHGDLREKCGRIRVKSSKHWLILAAIFLLVCLSGTGLMTLLILGSPITVSAKLIGSSIYIGLFLGCVYAMYVSIFRPYYLSKRLGPELEGLNISVLSKSKLNIVK